jgi:hypothetical protein
VSRPRERALALLVAALVLTQAACTIAYHETKNKYWMMLNGMEPLPPVTVTGSPGYVSYPLLISRKHLFAEVSDGCAAFPLEVDVKITLKAAPNIAVALLWLLVSGASAYTVPYRSTSPREADFTVKIRGRELKQFHYEDAKYVWIWLLAPFGIRDDNDEYYVEELIADQFVNSFIIDVYKDPELLAQMRGA